jgi:hypothetical protein
LLAQGQIRLRMNGGLRLKGSSAGLAFCLNTILALARMDGVKSPRSWLWRRLVTKMNKSAGEWAATGVVTADGHLKPVVLEPKLRACLQKEEIKHILTPHQPGTGRNALARVAAMLAPAEAQHGMRWGYASEEPGLRTHPCRHAAQAFMRIGELASKRQLALNIAAILISGVMLLAMSDLRGILMPPLAPFPTAPASPYPNYLWVSLGTTHPENFLVELQSHFWLNRRVEVTRHEGPNGSVRGEIPLQRLASFGNRDPQDGTIWVLRRHRFLNREFAPGQCVGQYDLTYIARIQDYD